MSEITSLSVLIPVYNCDVREFVNDLHRQCLQLSIPAEILCFDDFSLPHFKEINRTLEDLPIVQYKELDKNYGRSAIRNIMAEAASFDYLIFLDCDGKIVSENFISNYLSEGSRPVKIGGRVYSPNPPKDSKFYLHWLTGTTKEVFRADHRQKNPYESLMLNNIFISKEIYRLIKLDENIKGYGHEDSLFGFELQKLNIPVSHTDNPVQHQQLDDNNAFLSKSEEAVRNFAWMVKNRGAGKNTRLYKTYKLLHSLKLLPFFCIFIKLIYGRAQKNLLGHTPKLLYLDLLKIYWLKKAIDLIK